MINKIATWTKKKKTETLLNFAHKNKIVFVIQMSTTSCTHMVSKVHFKSHVGYLNTFTLSLVTWIFQHKWNINNHYNLIAKCLRYTSHYEPDRRSAYTSQSLNPGKGLIWFCAPTIQCTPAPTPWLTLVVVGLNSGLTVAMVIGIQFL